jgi:hypothetical protein
MVLLDIQMYVECAEIQTYNCVVKQQSSSQTLLYIIWTLWCIASVVVVIRPEVGVCRMKMLMNMDVY